MRNQRYVLPKTGRDWNIIEQEMSAFKKADHDWHNAPLPHYIWSIDPDLYDIQIKASVLYHAENALGAKKAFPSLQRMQSDIVDMALSFLGGGSSSGGYFTSGGTESIFLAVKAARDRARADGNFSASHLLNIVAPETAHPAFNKAGDYLGLEVRRIPTDKELRSGVEAMAEAIDDHTALIVGSAPQYPNGVFDRIEKLGALALERNIWLHVDACVGGFLAPFAKKLGYPIPRFDLSVPGVRTLSADLHKYGCCMKGASLLLYKDMADSSTQSFDFEWVRGTYATETFSGTRPGGPIAAAWGILNYLGEEGYMRKDRETMDTADALVAAINQIDELQVIQPRDLSILGYYSTAREVNINAVGDILANRGWFVGRSRKPQDCIQMAVNPQHGVTLKRYIADLKASVLQAREQRLVGKFDTASY